VVGLSALNFILRNTFYLAVSRDDDVHPETPEIDIRLGVGSDDGFYLLVGTNFLGSAGDRGFTYSWMDVSFQDEGLYPITLLYAANAAGQSGLELSWQVGTNAATPIIPQSALYVSPDLGDRLITFEEVPAGTVLSNQYAGTGVIFTVSSGALQVTTNFPAQFVSVTPPNVFADPNPNPSQPGIVDLSFVEPGTTNRATTDFVSFFILNAQNDQATVTAFDSGGSLLFTNSYHRGGASKELISINVHGISSVRLNLGQGTSTAAIDNLAFLSPVSLPDLVAAGIQAPPAWLPDSHSGLSGKSATRASTPPPDPGPTRSPFLPTARQVTARSSPQSPTPISATWRLAHRDPIGDHSREPGRQSLVRHYRQCDPRFRGKRQHPEQHGGCPRLHCHSCGGSSRPEHYRPATAQLGQTLNVSWIVQNAGTASAAASWNDRFVLSLSSNSLVNAVTLLTAPARSSWRPAPVTPTANW